MEDARKLIYREMQLEEAKQIREIDATWHIRNAWRWNTSTGAYELQEMNWTEYELPNGFDWHLNRCRETIRSGGKAFGCFEGDRLVGYVTLNAEIFGIHEKYVLLDQLFISEEHRNQGIGKELVSMCKRQVALFGAEKIYLCSASAEDTIAFYKKLGCKAETERNEELFAEDPNDIQLELAV